MSKIIEYLKLIPAGLQNPSQVSEGIMNALLHEHGKLPQDEAQEIERRRAICAACPFMSANAVKNPALNYTTERADDHCICCRCPIKTKTAALSSQCGLGSCNSKWNTNEPLKWEPYTKTN